MPGPSVPPSDADMLAMASAFDVLPYSSTRPGISQVRVERRNGVDHPESWAIVSMGDNLTRAGYWEWERSPSSRSEEFLEQARWSSAREAIDFARQHLATYPSGYNTEQDPGLRRASAGASPLS